MQPAGLAAHAARTAAKSGIYAYEQRDQARLTPEQERAFKRNRKAWSYFRRRRHGIAARPRTGW